MSKDQTKAWSLDVDGVVVLVLQHSDSLNTWEALGMHSAATDTLRDDMKACFISSEEDDDG